MSIVGYTFLDGDDETCRNNFIATEQQFLDLDKEEFNEVSAEKNLIVQDILDKQEQSNLSLVDNQDFINWSTTYGGPEVEDGFILFEPVAVTFLTQAGATPLTNVEELGPALDTLFSQRIFTNLETPIPTPDIAFESLDSCTNETIAVGFEAFSAIEKVVNARDNLES